MIKRDLGEVGVGGRACDPEIPDVVSGRNFARQRNVDFRFWPGDVVLLWYPGGSVAGSIVPAGENNSCDDVKVMTRETHTPDTITICCLSRSCCAV